MSMICKITREISELNKRIDSGRIYPAHVMEEAIREFNKKSFPAVILGNPFDKVALKDVVGRVQLSIENNCVVADMDIYETEKGKLLINMKHNGFDVEYHLIGYGAVDDDGIVWDYSISHVVAMKKDVDGVMM